MQLQALVTSGLNFYDYQLGCELETRIKCMTVTYISDVTRFELKKLLKCSKKGTKSTPFLRWQHCWWLLWLFIVIRQVSHNQYRVWILGVVYSYTLSGVQKDEHGWEQCVSVQLVPPYREELTQLWDKELNLFSSLPAWTPERWVESLSAASFILYIMAIHNFFFYCQMSIDIRCLQSLLWCADFLGGVKDWSINFK